MKLFILKIKIATYIDDKYWSERDAMTLAHIVRAETTLLAREQVCNSQEYGAEGESAWLDSDLTSCEELTVDGDPAHIMSYAY